MGHLDPRCYKPTVDIGARSVVVGENGTHLWGSVAPAATLASWRDPVRGGGFFQGCPAPGGLWQLTTTMRQFVRVVTEGTVLPLQDAAWDGLPVASGVSPYTRRASVQLEVTADDGVSMRRFQMDANQSITIVAQDVCVAWMGPVGTVDVENWTTEQRANVPLAGIVIDSFLGVALSRIEVPPGDNSSVILTKHLWVPATEVGTIEIPAYAKQVTIFQEPLNGTSSVMWQQTLGDVNGPSGGQSIASLPFIPGRRKTEPEAILGNVSHFATDIDPDFGRFFELVFTIRP